MTLETTSCVISSFITKPQPASSDTCCHQGCVISSFITKPQRARQCCYSKSVALYPLSSPNHNPSEFYSCDESVALYPLSSPNHNLMPVFAYYKALRYILFHHQTTTIMQHNPLFKGCVISSFITKPQRICGACMACMGCVISSFITKPQRLPLVHILTNSCVISSFITKPQHFLNF